MDKFIVWMFTPVVVMVIVMMALVVLIFDYIYELFLTMLKSESDE